jgi:hypothetical protein
MLNPEMLNLEFYLRAPGVRPDAPTNTELIPPHLSTGL